MGPISNGPAAAPETREHDPVFRQVARFIRRSVVILADGMVVGRFSKKWTNSTPAASARGIETWRDAPNARDVRVIPWTEMRRAVAWREGKRARFEVFHDSRLFVFKIRLTEARHVIEAFALALGRRFSSEVRAADFLPQWEFPWTGMLIAVVALVTGGLWTREMITGVAEGVRGAFGGFALCAGVLGFYYLASVWLEHPRRREPGHEPFRSRWLSLLLRLVGFAVFVTGFFAERSQRFASENDSLSLILSTTGILGTWIGALSLYIGYRIGVAGVPPGCGDGETPTVLFLRSFGDDGRHNLQPSGFFAAIAGVQPIRWLSWFGPLSNFTPRRMLALFLGRAADTAEEQLGRFLRKRASFIAIGRPDERLPGGGAERVYLRDDEWQDWVKLQLNACAVVFIMAGPGSGIEWEVRTVFESKAPDRIVVCLAALRGSVQRYEAFRRLFEATVRYSLPITIGWALFIRFDQDGGAHLVFPKYYSRLTWIFRGRGTNLERTLSDVQTLPKPATSRKSTRTKGQKST